MQTLNRSLFRSVPSQIYIKLVISAVTQAVCVTSAFERVSADSFPFDASKCPPPPLETNPFCRTKQDFGGWGRRYGGNAQTGERTAWFWTLQPATTGPRLEDLYAHSCLGAFPEVTQMRLTFTVLYFCVKVLGLQLFHYLPYDFNGGFNDTKTLHMTGMNFVKGRLSQISALMWKAASRS